LKRDNSTSQIKLLLRGEALPALSLIPDAYVLPIARGEDQAQTIQPYTIFQEFTITIPWSSGIDWNTVELTSLPIINVSPKNAGSFIAARRNLSGEGLSLTGTLIINDKALVNPKPISLTFTAPAGQAGLLSQAKAYILVATDTGI